MGVNTGPPQEQPKTPRAGRVFQNPHSVAKVSERDQQVDRLKPFGERIFEIMEKAASNATTEAEPVPIR